MEETRNDTSIELKDDPHEFYSYRRMTIIAVPTPYFQQLN
jgi:hypothetical protein